MNDIILLVNSILSEYLASLQCLLIFLPFLDYYLVFVLLQYIKSINNFSIIFHTICNAFKFLLLFKITNLSIDHLNFSWFLFLFYSLFLPLFFTRNIFSESRQKRRWNLYGHIVDRGHKTHAVTLLRIVREHAATFWRRNGTEPRVFSSRISRRNQ